MNKNLQHISCGKAVLFFKHPGRHAHILGQVVQCSGWSNLVIMEQDGTSLHNGFTANCYIKTLEENLVEHCDWYYLPSR